MISVVCWKWSRPGYRSTFHGEHVNALARMVWRWYRPDARVICVTNDPTGINSGIKILPDAEDFAYLPSPHGGNNPTCYRRLRAFHPDAAQWFGERFVSIDLDVVATAELAPLWDRPEAFVGWRDPFYGGRGQMCGSMMLLTAGAHPEVWNDFDPKRSPALAAAAGFRGSDQAWISYKLRGSPTWSKADGVYSYRADIEKNGGRLPADARMVMFHGQTDPWSERAQALPWVRENYSISTTGSSALQCGQPSGSLSSNRTSSTG